MGDVLLLRKVLTRRGLAWNDVFRYGIPFSHIFLSRRISLEANRSD